MPRRLHTRGAYPPEWPEIAKAVKDAADWMCIRCGHFHEPETGHTLTVHHFDGDKANCRWWNLLALCQRCHLQIQGRVNPEAPYFLEHSQWAKPYVAGFYAAKYQQRPDITRTQAEHELDALLALERLDNPTNGQAHPPES